MQRVTSRQRLFSWDQFDATAENPDNSSSSTSQSLPKSSPDLDDDASEVDYMTCYSISQANSKDLSRSISMLSMANFSAHAYEDDEDSEDEFEPSVISTIPSTTDLSAPIPALVDETLTNAYVSSGKKRSVDGSYAGMNKSVSFSNLVLVHSGFNDQKHDYPAVAASQHSKVYISSKVSNKSESLSSDISFLNLGEDIHIQCLAFLSLRDLQNLESTCKYNRLFLSSLPVRNCVWWNMINLMFPHLSLNETVPSTIDPLNKEKVNLSPACVKFINHDCSSSSDENAQNISVVTTNYCHNNIHYGSLLSKSLPSPPPTSINRHYFKSKPTNTPQVNENPQTPEFQELLGFASSDDLQEYRSYDLEIESNTKKVSVVQFTGKIAIGDRSIRSNHPFPRPHRLQPPTRFSALKGGDALKLFNRLRSCNRHGHAASAILEGYSSPLRSFVSPYISKMDTNSSNGEKISVEIDLTPRMIAYFEVSILPRDKSQEPRVDDRSQAAAPWHLHPELNQRQTRLNTDITNPCVAVGLSTHGFSDKSRMPGWDSFSYGYHGDDGGIFHSRGSMIRVYGPKYKEGDTIGCGVNYQNGGIFYTLNGNFLGYAWINEKVIIEGKVDLFPTIGVDSNSPLACNFGDRQFEFNFSDFVKTNGSKYGTA